MDAMDECDRKVDYILTHTCPERILHEFLYLTPQTSGKFHCRTAQFLNEVDNRMEFKEWHFGHMHMDHTYIETSDDGHQDIYQCHYNGEPKELE
jgi:hypothetical protein